jgi:dTDP-4-dehydrorhamnose reductase
MARILVLGADGMVGHISRIYLAERGHDVISVARGKSTEWDTLNVEEEAILLNYISRKNPDYILNCVGVLIKESEDNPERAIRLNSLLPRVISRHGLEFGYRLIHISSDCVFSGSAGPYSEGDLRDADEIYGRTKALGEIINDRDLTIRTSKVGPELHIDGSGLFNWFMKQHGCIKGFGNAMWGGVTTLEMAKFVDYAIVHNITGLLHLTNGEPISKYDLLCLFKDVWGKKDIVIQKEENKATNRSLVCSRQDLVYQIPSYVSMLSELHNFMRDHATIYSIYGLSL